MMLRAGQPVTAHLPQALRKEQRKNSEEDPSHFMPQRPHRVYEGLPESASKTAAASDGSASRIACRCTRIDPAGSLFQRTPLHLPFRLHRRRTDVRTRRRILRAILQNLRSNPRADPQLAS